MKTENKISGEGRLDTEEIKKGKERKENKYIATSIEGQASNHLLMHFGPCSCPIVLSHQEVAMMPHSASMALSMHPANMHAHS